MTLTAQDAERALNDVAMTERKTKLYTSLKGYDWISYLWGAIWVVGFVVQHVLSRREIVLRLGRVIVPAEGVFWFPLVILGLVAGALIMSHNAPIRSERDRELGRAIGFMWMSLYAFMGFWMLLVSAGAEGALFVGEAGERIVTAIYATIPMLALLIMGLFGCGRPLIFESVFITVMTAIGLLAAGEWFYLYMAIVGGGTQLAMGAAVQLVLRRESWTTTTE
jgi:hypothetical protein